MLNRIEASCAYLTVTLQILSKKAISLIKIIVSREIEGEMNRSDGDD